MNLLNFGNMQIVLAINYVYMPVFYDLQNQSCYTYLERRFDRRVKFLASSLYTVSVLFFLPVCIFIPSLALNQGITFIFYYWYYNKIGRYTYEMINVQTYDFIIHFIVTGINIYVITAVGCGICVFYTTIGGLRWEEHFETIIYDWPS